MSESARTMTEQELRFVAEKWIEEFGDVAPRQIRQWAQDQNLEVDAPRFLERIAAIAERMLAERRAAALKRPA
jgi:hypothetical protein